MVLEIASNALTIPSTITRPATVDLTTVLETSVNANADANRDEDDIRKKRQSLECAISS